jgi:hypothetical protein
MIQTKEEGACPVVRKSKPNLRCLQILPTCQMTLPTLQYSLKGDKETRSEVPVQE